MFSVEVLQPTNEDAHRSTPNTKTVECTVAGCGQVSARGTTILALGHGQHGAELVFKDAIRTTDHHIHFQPPGNVRLDGVARLNGLTGEGPLQKPRRNERNSEFPSTTSALQKLPGNVYVNNGPIGLGHGTGGG